MRILNVVSCGRIIWLRAVCFVLAFVCWLIEFTVFSFLFLSLAYIGDDDSVQVRIIAGVTVAIVALVVVVIVMIVLYLRRYVGLSDLIEISESSSAFSSLPPHHHIEQN